MLIYPRNLRTFRKRPVVSALGSFAGAISIASLVALLRVCFELLVHDYGAIVRMGETYVVWKTVLT